MSGCQPNRSVLFSLIAQWQFGPRARWQPLGGTLAGGLEFGDVSLSCPTVVQLLVFIYSCMQWGWP